MSDYNIPVSGGVNGLNVPLHGHIAVYNKEFPVIPNPEGEATGYVTKLGFTPEILQVKDPEVHDWARAEEKPTYTKAEVGLGNVDNTSDLNKPISTATQTALDGKVDKVPGKALSTNDYTDTDKAIVDGVTSALATKVDKIAGKGLSSNDYTDYEKTKLAYIQSGAEVNVQADWFEANRWSDAFILNKPTKLSDFSNDTGFITSTVDNLTYYYKKSETYTQAEVNALIGSIVTISFLVVQTLPQTGEANIIYLVPADEPNPDNIYEEYIYVNSNWEMIGTTKVDLSNYYTKTQTDTLLNGKVDKVEGKGLSTNDYTDTEKALVGTIEDKLDKTETAVNSNGLVIATPVTDTAPYIYRQTPVKESFKALMKKIVGASVVWNQLWNETKIRTNTSNGLSYSANSDHSLTINGTLSSSWSNIYTDASLYIELKPSNVYMLLCDTTNLPNGNFMVRCQTSSGGNSGGVSANRVVKTNANVVKGVFRIEATSQTEFDNIKIGKPIFIDLTAMFGTTIADYVYTLETSQSGSGIAWLQSYGFFTEDYYAYKQNTIESVNTSGRKVVGKNRCVEVVDNALSISGTTRVVVYGTGTTAFIECKKGETYTVSGATGRNRALVGYFDDIPDYQTEVSVFDNSTEANGQIFSTTTTGYSFTAQYTGYAGIYLANSVLANVNIQVEIGTTATDYVPYAEPTTYPISPITLRGLFKLSTDKLTVDGDEYNADGSVTRKYEQRAYQSGDESLANAITDGTNTIVKLVTPTTEQTTPFTETEIVGSTEEFIDYEVAQGNRDVAIPVGTETDYYQEMKLPSLPTTSGNHNLIYNIATGFGWS